ncbi:hypothetical protein [Thermogemmatispora sp.]|uniref:hypothetical protein n=1 Tax=Thermogemmatispora sp. TaxID=1968838 RepID=UPI0035E41703
MIETNGLPYQPEDFQSLQAADRAQLPANVEGDLPTGLHNQIILRAVKEIRSLQKLREEKAGQKLYFYLSQTALEKVADKIVDEQTKVYNPQEKLIFDNCEDIYEKARELYVNTIKTAIQKGSANKLLGKEDSFIDEFQANLARIAREQREFYLSVPDKYQRDIAVLAAWQARRCAETSLSSEEREQLHRDADWYERVIKENIEVIEWPREEEPFRR